MNDASSHAKRAIEPATSEKVSHAKTACQPLTGPILGDEWIDRQWIESCQQTYFPALTHYTAAVERAIKAAIKGAQE